MWQAFRSIPVNRGLCKYNVHDASYSVRVRVTCEVILVLDYRLRPAFIGSVDTVLEVTDHGEM
jgi:hypothetical protein